MMVLKCDICGEVDEESFSDEVCKRCSFLESKAYDRAFKEISDRLSNLEKCSLSIGMALISVERSHPGHLAKIHGERFGSWMKKALKEYDEGQIEKTLSKER
jgi:hypothetical protein